jgi:hypothetical protein
MGTFRQHTGSLNNKGILGCPTQDEWDSQAANRIRPSRIVSSVNPVFAVCHSFAR